MDLNKPVRYLKGVGPKKATLLNKIGVNTIYDLITYYPRTYEDRAHLKLIGQIQDGEFTTIQATVIEHKIIPTHKGKRLLKIILSDGTGKASLVCFNQFYLKDYLTKGTTIIISGKFERTFGGVEITNFTYEILTKNAEDLIHTGRIVPIYPLAEGLNARFLRALIKKVVDEAVGGLTDMLPADIRSRNDLISFGEAIKNIHFPEDSGLNHKARERLVFDEFFLLETGLAIRRKKIEILEKGISYKIKRTLLSDFRKILPFDFTPEQKKVINEIFKDMQSEKPMNRLLQGDVGSGKTVVALASLLLAVENGYQGVLMAPTEILAQQHYLSLNQMLKSLVDENKIRIGLFVGSMKKAEREKVIKAILEGKTDIIIGTHTLIQEKMQFHRLGLIVIDEQHKFGVVQRSILRKKGFNPDVLVMTATPIPRTLSLTVYGDLDVSVIEKPPPGRGNIRTLKVGEKEAYDLVKDEIAKGRQAYIVYPLIEESETLTLKAAKIMTQKLQKEVFGKWRVGLLHGKLSGKEKEAIMNAFRNQEIDILVATSVIEVGLDIPNASVMVIEEVGRFGLASLHQLRGRVGRGNYDSYCILVGKVSGEEAVIRVKTMLNTTDGFKIAEEDLALRGPGEFFGTRQHGLPELKIGNIIQDFNILVKARREAFDLVEKDVGLSSSQNRLIKDNLLLKFKGRLDLIGVG
jgi:ATP-dependent DNA helicase RecG